MRGNSPSWAGTRPEDDDQVVPFIMVDKSDGAIDSKDNIFKAESPAKLERLIQTQKNTHYKVRKEKAYAYLQ